MESILKFVFALVIPIGPCFAETMHCLEVSKACFGSGGPTCAYHNLRCSNGRITIQEAFYTDSTACGTFGVAGCGNVSVNSIPVTGTRHNFNEKELNSLDVNCSTQSTCSLRADRRVALYFSAIIYKCINASDNHNKTCNETTTTGASNAKKPTTGTVVGIIIPICIFIAGAVTAVLIFRRRKIRQKGENGNVAKPNSNSQEVHSLEKKSSHDYATTIGHLDLVPKEHNMPAPLKSSSDYDFAKCDDQKANRDHLSSRNTRDSDHNGRQPARENCHYDTTVSVAGILKGGHAEQEVYSYNHLNEKVPSHANVDSTYNTTASTRHKMNVSSNDMEDDYGYNHLGTELKKKLPQNEYDTTASAVRDVARMNGDMDDPTYDHAHLLTSGSSSAMTNTGFQESDYNHASPLTMVNKDAYRFNASLNGNPKEDGGTDLYTLARETETNPYQLAK